MSVLLLVEHEGGAVRDATLSALSAAAQIGEVHALLLGDGEALARAAEQAARLAGVTRVLTAEREALGDMLPEAVAPLIAGLMAEHDALVCAATSTGKGIAPRVAALLDVMQVSEVLSVLGPRTFTRPIYAGNAIATVETTDAKTVLTVRATAFAKALPTDAAAPIEAVAPPAPQQLSRLVGRDSAASHRPELTSAKVVVAGGRALKDAESFRNLIEPLADALHGAIGASRAAVDAGYVSNDHQVGQTGKIVAPDLYVAVGISGAIQHLAGMKDAATIVAINKDAEAPIMQVADFALVGDLFEIVPELTEKLQRGG